MMAVKNGLEIVKLVSAFGWIGLLALLSIQESAAQNSEPTTIRTNEPADLATTASSTPTPAPTSLDLTNATIGHIDIRNDNIFDLDDPEENKRLYRIANKLHIRTRPKVIAAQLLFEPGDSYSKRVTEETERLLRSNRYIVNAEITPTRVQNGVVDLQVRTTDVWTLSPSLSFGRGGGENSTGISLKEYNLLGLGTRLGIGYQSNVDRNSTTLEFSNRNFFGSRYGVVAEYANNSDGFRNLLAVTKPFFSLDSRHAGGASLGSRRSIESLYDRGEVVSRYELDSELHEAFIGWSAGLRGKFARRYTAGIVYDDNQFSPVDTDLLPLDPLPPGRRFVYPFVGMELVEDDFIEERNVDQIGRIEDRYLGTWFRMRIGYSSERLDSTADAWHMQGQFSRALYATKNKKLLLSSFLRSRIEDGEVRNAQLSVATRYDMRQSEKRLLHLQLSGSVGHNLDLDNPVYVGGDNGLRGYPLRYQGGDSSLLFTIEQRLFTKWYPWRLFRIGGAVFFDAGRTWGDDPANSPQLGWLKNVGVGLRVFNSRSGIGRMIHIDLAFPLDGENDIGSVQFLIESKRGF